MSATSFLKLKNSRPFMHCGLLSELNIKAKNRAAADRKCQASRESHERGKSETNY